MKNNILLVLALLLLASCQKQPTANFNTDKTLYYAGETVHLTDASTNAHHWYWTMPDGTTFNNQNVDYVISTNDLGGDKTFSLTVTSKNGNKLSTVSKTVQASQQIYSSDTFIVGFMPQYKELKHSGNKWYLYMKKFEGPECYYDESYFYLPEQPSNIVNFVDSFQSGNSIYYLQYCAGWGDKINATNGLVNYHLVSNHLINIHFSNSKGTDNNVSIINISGNLTFHY